MVSNVTSLPSFVTASLTQKRDAAAALPDTAELSPQRGAVAVDVADAAYRSDVIDANDDVASARGALDLALGVGRIVRGALLEIRDQALRATDPGAPDDLRGAQDGQFKALVQGLAQRIEAEIAGGAKLLGGVGLEVYADPDSDAAHLIDGADLRLKARPGPTDTIALALDAGIATRDSAQASARAADTSLGRLDAHLRRFEGEAARLDGHAKLLGALDAALAPAGARDLDADGARLLALQVRQDLTQSSAPIASARPSSILAYFRE